MRRMAHKLRAILPIFIEKSLSDKQVIHLRLSPSYRPFPLQCIFLILVDSIIAENDKTSGGLAFGRTNEPKETKRPVDWRLTGQNEIK